MVPMRSPAARGSSGASGGSGWGGSNNEGGWRSHSYDRDRSSTPGSRTCDGVNIEAMGIEMNILVECLVHMVVDEDVMVVEEDVMVEKDMVRVPITIEGRSPILKGMTLVMETDGV